MKKLDTKAQVVLGLLTALEIILSRFLSISAWNIKIGFSFVPIVMAAVLYGPFYAGAVAASADFLGAILFPIGPYFPGFTLTAFLMGIVFGIFLHKDQTLFHTAAAVFINQFILSLFLNTFWISVLYGSPFGALFTTRILQTLLLYTVQFAAIRAMVKISALFRIQVTV